MKLKINNFNITKLKTLIINIYFIIMNIIIISVYFYYRFLAKRAEYSLDSLKDSANSYYFLISMFFILLHIYLIINILKIKILNNNTPSKLMIYIQKVIEFLIWKPLNYLLDVITPDIPYSGTLIIKYCYFFRESEFRLNMMKGLAVIFYFIPRIFMCILFFIETIYHNRVEYCIKLFWILLIPLIYIFFINLCEYFFKNNIDEIYKGLIVTPTGLPNDNGLYTAHYFTLKPNSGYSPQDLKGLIENWSLLFYLINLNAMIRIFISKYSPYITLFTSSCYLSALSYKLYYLYILP